MKKIIIFSLIALFLGACAGSKEAQKKETRGLTPLTPEMVRDLGLVKLFPSIQFFLSDELIIQRSGTQETVKTDDQGRVVRARTDDSEEIIFARHLPGVVELGTSSQIEVTFGDGTLIFRSQDGFYQLIGRRDSRGDIVTLFKGDDYKILSRVRPRLLVDTDAVRDVSQKRIRQPGVRIGGGEQSSPSDW